MPKVTSRDLCFTDAPPSTKNVFEYINELRSKNEEQKEEESKETTLE